MWVYDFFKVFGFCWQFTNEELLRIDGLKSIEGIINSKTRTFKSIFRRRYNLVFDYKKGIEFEEFLEDWKRTSKDNYEFERDYEYVTNFYNEQEEKKINLLNKLEKNSYNYKMINNYCLKVLKYFYPDITNEWLMEYRENDITLSCIVTKAGEKADIYDFIII